MDGRAHGKNIRILSDTDLLIENMHLHSPDHQFTFKNLAAHVINITITNTTVEETKLTFSGGNISVRIENSLIQSSPMHSHDLSKSVTATKKPRSSAFKSLSFKGTNVQLYSSHFTGIKAYHSMLCSEGNMTLMDVSANGIEGDFMISKQCNVQITNSHFTENNGFSLISVREGKLIMENSHFINNTSKYKGIVYLKDSEAHLISSTFTRNQGGKA